MAQRFIVRSLVALGFVAGAFAAQRPAAACGGGDWDFEPAVDMRPVGLDSSEKELGEGKVRSSAARVIRMFPALRATPVGARPMLDRAHRILAMAIARSGGALDVEREVPGWLLGSLAGKTAADRTANLRWAVETMEHLSAAKKGDPALQSELGEVLAKVDARQGEALAMLGKLAEKDLLASPEGYATLARLRQRAGDAGGREEALKKCEAMAKAPAVCGRERVAAADGTKGPS